mmetsp:Transcript_51052/g.84781  ORF Transcript_51052/g.84781 Transcript_51052/m.84781 type:complete len:135 (+) Transcript_51052:3564-3968(+)
MGAGPIQSANRAAVPHTSVGPEIKAASPKVFPAGCRYMGTKAQRGPIAKAPDDLSSGSIGKETLTANPPAHVSLTNPVQSHVSPLLYPSVPMPRAPSATAKEPACSSDGVQNVVAAISLTGTSEGVYIVGVGVE